jgi:hypothetical protein
MFFFKIIDFFLRRTLPVTLSQLKIVLSDSTKFKEDFTFLCKMLYSEPQDQQRDP